MSVASTIVYAPPHSKRFYYSNEQKAKIDEEVEKCPDVSCYLADPEDLLIVPTKIDPAVANFYEVIVWPSIEWGSISCRWRYWSRMLACCIFHL